MNILESKCKLGGCSSIGCEDGIYCFNADGTAKITTERIEIKFSEFCKSFSKAKNEEQLVQERLKSVEQAIKVNIEDL